jgi:hypothetical protein
MTVSQLLIEEYVNEIQIFGQHGASLWGKTAAFASSS